MSIARAIDVGHGNTKFTTSSDGSAGFDCTFFPSIAPHTAGELDIQDGFFSKQETVNITIDNVSYTVGKDVKGHGVKRILDDSFPLSSIHLALVRGALYYMGSGKIDVLALGLPLNTYKMHSQALKKKMEGRHVLPPRPGKDRAGATQFVVDVENVIVMPQPMGAFYNCFWSSTRQDPRTEMRNLIIDVGHGTLDWLVTDSNQVDYSRSGAEYTGMSAVVKAIAAKIHDKASSNFNTLQDIDRSIRTGCPVMYAGKTYQAEEFKSIIDSTVKNSLAGMLQKIGDPDDLQNIIVTGGGAATFMPEIRKSFSHHNLILDEDAMYSNVRGFHKAGVTAMANPVKKVA